MIASSDNDAVIMLRTVVGDAPLNDVFRDFGLVIPEVRTLDDSMTVREYSAFFRILYNASYLNKAMSEKALEYLAASEFKQALVAGIPPGVIVAHKYGERSFDDKKSKQLHDCEPSTGSGGTAVRKLLRKCISLACRCMKTDRRCQSTAMHAPSCDLYNAQRSSWEY